MPLRYRDKRIRTYKVYNGKKEQIMIRRLICSIRNGGCGRIHNELPDILVAYKHYASEVIENVIDGVSTPYDLTSEDYPCEITMKQRWPAWISANHDIFEAAARQINSQSEECCVSASDDGPSGFSVLRRKGPGWLPKLLKAIYNSGGRTYPAKERSDK